MNCRPAVFKLALVFFLLGGWAAWVPPATAQDEVLTGWFSFIVADYPTEAGLAAETTYTLTEDSGEWHELLIDSALMQPLGGPVALNRKRVTVAGEWEQTGPDETEKFRVRAIQLEALPDELTPPEGTDRAGASPASPLPASRTAVTGSQAWVTILCRFGDARNITPHPVSFYEKLMGMAYPGLGHYWKEVSYGHVPDLAGSLVVGWYDLPQPRSSYVSANADGEDSADINQLTAACIAAADADVVFPNFQGINMVFNQALDGAAYGGAGFLTLDGRSGFWGTALLPDWAHERQAVWAHEMGHGFGLLHSSGPYAGAYDSEWDVMSGGRSDLPHPSYGPLGVHTIAYHKDFLGWVPADRKYVAARNTTRTLSLERLAQPGSEGYLMAQIPLGGSTTDFYTVETRRFAGYDDGVPAEAVVIHKVNTTRDDRLAQVVDPDNNGDPNDEGAMWTVGETFTDPANGLRVSVDAALATGFRVTIAYTACSDTLSSTRQLLAGRGGKASVSIAAPSGCRWAAVSNSPWLRITAGRSGSGSGRVSYEATANPGPNARTGTLTIDGWTLTVVQAGGKRNLFADDMESGTGDWSPDTPWALTTASARSGRQAWTDSPGGHYRNDQRTTLRSPRVDLTAVRSATLTFWHRFDFADGDGGEVWIGRSTAGGQWAGTQLRTFTGTQTGWQRVSIDLRRFVGGRITLSFEMFSDATGTADGWYIDDVAVFSSDFAPTQATLENPQPDSFQSGIGIISGWACHASEIVLELNGTPLPAAYGTVREDTRSVCGDTDNGFSLLWNWNTLGAGRHTVRALLDGEEFANTTVQVTTFGEAFLRGVNGMFPLPDFPRAGQTTVVRWEEALQNFVITDGQPHTGGGYNRVAGVNAVLENPSLGSAQSGIGIISGWACEAGEIVIELNGTPLPAAYGTTREDTRGNCGDINNGFSLLWNWNNLGAGTHTVRALRDGREFANTTVRVITFGEPFLRGASGTFPLPDFPRVGQTTRVRWEEALQSFVIIP